MSNRLDPDQDRQNVDPDLGPNCLQRLSVDDKSHLLQELNKNKKTAMLACLTLILLLFFVQKMSVKDVCCICSNALQTNFIMEANIISPDQSAQEQSDLGPYCLQYSPIKCMSRREQATTIMNSRKRVNPIINYLTFKGMQVKIIIIVKISVPNDRFFLYKITVQTIMKCGILCMLSGSSQFAKISVYGFPL